MPSLLYFIHSNLILIKFYEVEIIIIHIYGWKNEDTEKPSVLSMLVAELGCDTTLPGW